jgi:hypothetical protein
MIQVVFHLPKYVGRLPFAKTLRLSSIFPNIDAVFHLPNYWGRLPFAKVFDTMQQEHAQGWARVWQGLQPNYWLKKRLYT